MTETEKDLIICMSCMASNYKSDDFCQNCRALLATISTLDPLQTIQDEGSLWRKATSARPKFIVVLGTWILFVPWIVGAILLEVITIFNWQGFGSLILFWLGVALFLIALDILFTVTKNYLTMPEKAGAAK